MVMVKKTYRCFLTAFVLTATLLSYAAWTNLSADALVSSSITLSSTGAIVIPSPNAAYVTCVIYLSNGITYVRNGSSGFNLYSDANAVSAFMAAFAYVSNGGSVTVQAGTYVGRSWNSGLTLGRYTCFTMRDCANVNVTFEPGAILTIADHMNVNVFTMFYNVNCTISNIQIDGNSVVNGVYGNQGNERGVSSGIQIWNCDNCQVVGAKITNCQRDGFVVGSDDDSYVPSGITNSIITWCGSNGVTLEGWGNYANNVSVAACSDVGITVWEGIGCRMTNNYVYDINWTYGSGGSSHYAYGVEYGSNYNRIENNTALGCEAGIVVGTGMLYCSSNLVADNYIFNCKTGVGTFLASDNVFTRNRIVNWGKWYGAGIMLNNSTRDMVYLNTLTNSATFSSIGYAIYEMGTSHCSIYNNTIAMQPESWVTAVFLELGASNTLIRDNNVQADIGIWIADSTCMSNRVVQNNLANCTTAIIDGGTGTLRE